MTIDILSISIMSDEPECVFSEAYCMISWERSLLESNKIKKIECLKHWKRSDILNDFEDNLKKVWENYFISSLYTFFRSYIQSNLMFSWIVSLYDIFAVWYGDLS